MSDKPTKDDDAHDVLSKMDKHDVEQPGDTPTHPSEIASSDKKPAG